MHLSFRRYGPAILLLLVVVGTSFFIQPSQAATPTTLKLVGPTYVAGSGETVVDIQQPAATVQSAITNLSGTTLVIVLPGVPNDFAPVVVTDIAVHVVTNFVAVKGTVAEMFGQQDVTFLFAVQWPDAASLTPSFSLGVKVPSLSLAAINPDWKLPINDQPDIADAFVAVATGPQDFPVGSPQAILDFYPANLSANHTIEAGAAIQGTLLLKTVLGENAVVGLFGNANQTVTIAASIQVGNSVSTADDAALLNQAGDTAPSNTPVNVNVHLEASLPLANPVGFPGYLSAVGTWALTLDVATANKQITVGGSGQLQVADSVFPPAGIRLAFAFSVSHSSLDQTTAVSLETGLAAPVQDVFGTGLDINNLQVKATFSSAPGQSAADVEILGEFAIGGATASASFHVTTEQGALKSAEAVVDFTDVDLAALFSWASTQLGFDSASVDAALSGLMLDSAHLRLTIEKPAPGQTRIEFASTATVTYNALQADLLVYALKKPTGQLGSGLTIALHLHSPGGPVTLGDVISSLGEPFASLPLPDVALGFSTIGHPWNVAPIDDSAETPPEVVDFLKGIYFPGNAAECADIDGCTGRQARFDIPAGGFLVSSFLLPESLNGVLDKLWIDHTQPVLIKGTAGIFGSNKQLSLEAVLPPMGPDPANNEGAEWFESGQLSFGIRVQLASPSVEAYIRGEVTVHVPDTSESCGYDRLRFAVEAAIQFDLTSFEATLMGALIPAGAPPSGICDTSGGLAAWHTPFGQDWLDVNGLALQLGIQVSPAGVDLTIGFAASIRIGTTDIQGSFALGLTPTPTAPFIIVKPLGFRIASAGGVSFQDLISFYNDHIAGSGMEVNLPDGWDSFDVAIKNFELSYAIEDKPELCLFQGIRIRGYLYLGIESQGYTPADAVLCTPGLSTNVAEPPKGDAIGCAIQSNKDHGCFAGVDLVISASAGFSAHVEIGAFTLGPIETEQATFDILANASTVQFSISGGVSIEGVFQGHLELSIEPDGFHFLSQLALFPPNPIFQAQVQGEASFSLSDPHFILDARIASTFGAAMEPIVRPLAEAFAAGIQVINGFITVLQDPTKGFDALIDYVVGIPGQLRQLDPVRFGNDPLVLLLDVVTTGIQGARDTAAALGIPLSLDNLINVVLQGAYIGTPPAYGQWTDFGIFGSGCFIDWEGDDQNCVLIPAIGFTIPGICPSLVAVPNCNAQGLKTLMVGSLNTVMAEIFGVSLTELQASLTRIATNFTARPIIFDVACAGFHLELGKGDSVSRNAVSMYAKFIILGSDVVVGPLTWNFDADFATNLSGVLSGLGDALFGTSPAFACDFDGVDEPITAVQEPPSNLTQTGSLSVTEGGSVSLSGTFDPGTAESGDTQTVTVTWPGGSVETLTVPVGTSSFTSAAHSFADDNPTGTPSDQLNILVEVVNDRTGSVSASFKMTVNNVAPSVTSLTVAPAEANEGSQVTLTGAFTDPGTPDSFAVTLSWADGTVEQFSLAAGTTSFTRTHTYADDPKAADDKYPVKVVLKDDDTGMTESTAYAVIRNVAPTLDAGSVKLNRLSADGQTVVESDVSSLKEGDLFEVVGTFTDPGTADTHEVQIDLGNGAALYKLNVVPASPPTATRTFRAGVLRYPDDNPTTTPFDPATVKVKVVDDDGGESATAEKSLTIHNVDPSVAIQTVPFNENETASIVVTITDPGITDTFVLTVNWGDGSGPVTQDVAANARVVTLTHQYRDDNPTGTPSDTYVISASVLDDDTGTGATAQGQVINNLAPRWLTSSAPVTVQYSDSMPTPLTVTFDDVSADAMTAATSYRYNGGLLVPGLPDALVMTTGPCATSVAAGLPAPRTACSWSISGRAMVAPGVYTITVTATDDDTGATPTDVTLIVTPEDARVDYTGPTFVSAPSVNTGSIALELRATVRDISVVPGVIPPDIEPGDITHATVTFVDRTTNAVLCTAPVVRIFAGNDTTGGASCTANFATPGANASWPFTVGMVVGGWYIRDAAADNVLVTVLKPSSNYIHGSGAVKALSSAGSFTPAVGSPVSFDNKPIGFGVDLKKFEFDGAVTFTSGGRTYRATITSVDSLGIVRQSGQTQNIAQVEARAKLQDITSPSAPLSLDTGLRLQLRYTDSPAPSTPDTFSFALWARDGLLIGTSSWNVVRPAEAILSAGQVLWKQ